MSRFVKITYRSGSMSITKHVNADRIIDFNPERREAAISQGDKVVRVILTPESAEYLDNVLSMGESELMDGICRMQRDIDAYKTFFVNVLGWCKGTFREGRAIPALCLFSDVSGEVNDELDMMMRSVRQLNDEYVEMKEKLEKAGIVPLDSKAVDPDKQ